MSSPTPSQTIGPFLHIGMSDSFGAELVHAGSPGAIRLHGSVLDGAGERRSRRGRRALAGRCRPSRAAIRGTAGGSRSSSARPDCAFFEVGVFARGLLKRVATRLYFPDTPADDLLTAIDPGRRATLVAVAEPDGSLRWDIRLQGDGETVFFGP